MSSGYEEKLKAIRIAEGHTQASFAEITGINVGTIKNYESGKREVGISVIDRVLEAADFKKYTMWLMTGDAIPETNQISPAPTHDETDGADGHQKTKKAG